MPTRRTKRTLQPKLDGMLAKCIADVRSLGYEPTGDILPHVRITTNSRGLGECRDTAKALRRVRRGVYDVIPGRRPVFLISCSVNAGESDQEFLDVLYHEVIHTLPSCFSHGREFKDAAHRVNEAFGANVQTSKRAGDRQAGGQADGQRHDRRSEVMALVGSTIRMRRPRGDIEFVVRGLNGRPKKCVDLTRVSDGESYVTTPDAVLAAEVVRTPCAGGKAPAQGWAAAPTREQVAAMAGKVLLTANGRRMRVDGVNGRPKNCVELTDAASGRRYLAPLTFLAGAREIG